MPDKDRTWVRCWSWLIVLSDRRWWKHMYCIHSMFMLVTWCQCSAPSGCFSRQLVHIRLLTGTNSYRCRQTCYVLHFIKAFLFLTFCHYRPSNGAVSEVETHIHALSWNLASIMSVPDNPRFTLYSHHSSPITSKSALSSGRSSTEAQRGSNWSLL